MKAAIVSIMLLMSLAACTKIDYIGESYPPTNNVDLYFSEADLRMGIVDKQTICERRGYDWDTVKARQDEEQQAQEDIGSFLLKSFNRGGNAPANNLPLGAKQNG